MSDEQPLTRRELRERERRAAAEQGSAAAEPVTTTPGSAPSAAVPASVVPPAASVVPPAASVVPPAASAVPPSASVVPPAPSAVPPSASASVVPPAPSVMPPSASVIEPPPAGPIDLAPPPGAAHDDYFERLATASADDAPTGMIVMPEVLTPNVTGALSRAGDVMVTGSMRVSRELSTLGAYREGLDQSSDDTDGIVTDGVRGDHDPVRARDAVAAQRQPAALVAPAPERRITTWIWVVAAAIGVVAVGGGALLLVGLMNGWF